MVGTMSRITLLPWDRPSSWEAGTNDTIRRDVHPLGPLDAVRLISQAEMELAGKSSGEQLVRYPVLLAAKFIYLTKLLSCSRPVVWEASGVYEVSQSRCCIFPLPSSPAAREVLLGPVN
jgi:hypothetical protein